MTYRPSKILVAALAAALCAFQAPAAQTNAAPSVKPADGKSVDKMTALFGDPVIARGKGFEIKRSELDSAMIGIRSASAARGQPIPAEYLDMYERKVLEQLIQIQILLQKATDADKVEGKESAEKNLAIMLKRAGSQEMFDLQLKSVGLTSEQMHARMIEEATAERVVERELKVNITDEDAKKFYDDHPSRFEEPESVRVAQIFKATRDPATGQALTDAQKDAKRKEMDAILKKARGGEDFAKLARESSDDTEAKKTGGEIQPFPRDSMPRTPEFEAAAFSLSTNQISDVVATQYGYHIIKLLEKIPARKSSLDSVKVALKEGLKQQELIKRLPEYSEKLRTDSKVEILDEKLKALPAAPAADSAAPGAPVEKAAH